MSLCRIYGPGRFALSYELFPPKTQAGERALFRHLHELVGFGPSFVTCTYGAGGSTRDRTLDTVQRVKETFHIPVASHLTCVGAMADQLRAYLAEAAGRHVDYIVAVRGDPPRGEKQFQPVEGGLRFANELVGLIRGEFPRFGIAVAGYPEVHQEASSPEADLANLKRKVECGADIVVTQLFYNNDDFFRFRERYERIGIQVPLVPGILPVTTLSQVRHITSLCGARLPNRLVAELDQKNDPEWQFQVGVEHAVQQVRGLIEAGIPGIHFYVLNKSQATCQVLQAVELPDRKLLSRGGPA
jgi:methylenetetrahydrofolate reductase (NADPH)